MNERVYEAAAMLDAEALAADEPALVGSISADVGVNGRLAVIPRTDA